VWCAVPEQILHTHNSAQTSLAPHQIVTLWGRQNFKLFKCGSCIKQDATRLHSAHPLYMQLGLHLRMNAGLKARGMFDWRFIDLGGRLQPELASNINITVFLTYVDISDFIMGVQQALEMRAFKMRGQCAAIMTPVCAQYNQAALIEALGISQRTRDIFLRVPSLIKWTGFYLARRVM